MTVAKLAKQRTVSDHTNIGHRYSESSFGVATECVYSEIPPF
jgi:hypothetical protein